VSDGFGITARYLDAEECDRLTETVSGIPHGRAGIRHLMSDPLVAELAKSDRLMRLAADWLGGTAIPFRATLFEKSADANWLIPWHQDTALPLANEFQSPGWGPWSEKGGVMYAHAPAWALDRVIALRVHLDASDADNGPLRVIPGSHGAGVLTDAEISEYALKGEVVECLTPRGGVVAMRPLVIHSSSKLRSEEPRRVLHIEYADSLDFGERIQLAVC